MIARAPICRLLLAALVAVSAAGQAAAQAPVPPLGKTPYQVRLVVLVGEHRFLGTEQFQEQFPRELIQRTKLALGDLVQADAATTHSLAETIRQNGLDAAVDSFEEISSRRTWFFVVRVKNGLFEIQGRYFDGLTGIAGPRSATVVTSDRSRLAALAAGMVADRFAYVGAVKAVKGDAVELAVVGSELTDTGISRGAAFAVSRVAVESGKSRARRLPWAVLEATGPVANGAIACQYWRRFVEDKIAPTGGVEFRALLLPTINAPLRLRIVDHDTSQPLPGIGVSIRGSSRELVTDAAGQATSPEAVAGLAIVKLSRGGTPISQFPVPIVDEKTIVADITPRTDSDDAASLEIRKMQLVKRMLETLHVVDQRFGEQQVLLNQSLERSLEHARITLRLLDEEIAAIRAERDEIHLIEMKQHPDKKRAGEGDKGIARLTQIRQVTGESIARITQAIADREVQTEKQRQAVKLVEQAALLESQSQFDEALTQYEKAASLLPESAKIRERLTKLKADWEIKSDLHRAARKFLIETWPKMEVDGIKYKAALAEKHLEICRKADDRLTPRRFITANLEHLAKISKIAEQLKKSRNADDQRQLQTWNEAFASLRHLSNLANDISQPAIAEKKD